MTKHIKRMGDSVTFGPWLKQRRALLDLTQRALAAQSGCTVETIRKLEANRRRPSRPLAERLAEALHIPAAERAAFRLFARGRSPAVSFAAEQTSTADPS
jgi:transcriptional regulator with XRE-family HTH domain